VSFAAITICVASQRVFIVVVYFVIDLVQIVLDTLSYSTLQISSANLNGNYTPFWDASVSTYKTV